MPDNRLIKRRFGAGVAKGKREDEINGSIGRKVAQGNELEAA